MNTIDIERAKYEAMVDVPNYHDISPGERFVNSFIEESGAKRGQSIIDLGCGPGRVSADLAARGYDITRLDITPTALQVEDNLPFIRQSIWEPIEGSWDFGFCCDVMEHLPIEYTMATLHRISEACGACWFSIAFFDDLFGDNINERLHLTVKPYKWWLSKMEEVGYVQDARDLFLVGLFYVRFR